MRRLSPIYTPRQTRALSRAYARAHRAPILPRLAPYVLPVILCTLGGILFCLFSTLYVFDEYNHDYPQAVLVMQLGALSGFLNFVAGVFMLCVTATQQR